MTKVDIYSEEAFNADHSLRYLHITARDVIGILNRIASLMRRRRYNMEEVSVSFDNEGKAHIIVAVDGRLHDVNHVIEQVKKLYDVFEVVDATHQHDQLYHMVFVKVDSEERFKSFPVQPDKIVGLDDGLRGLFVVSLEDMPRLMQFIQSEKYPYRRRIMGLI